MSGFTASYYDSKKMKQIGFPQNSRLYYHIKTKEVKMSEDIAKFRDWDKFYLAALTDRELDTYIPEGTVMKKRSSGKWTAEFETFITRGYDNPLDAKTELILKLFRKNLIKFR